MLLWRDVSETIDVGKNFQSRVYECKLIVNSKVLVYSKDSLIKYL